MARSKKSVKKAKKKPAVKKAAKKAAKKKPAARKRAKNLKEVFIEKEVDIKKKLKHEDHPEFIRIGFEEQGFKIK